MRIDIEGCEKCSLYSIIDPADKDVLEIGCGYGEQMDYLAKETHQYFAVDTNEKAIEYLKHKYIRKKDLDLQVADVQNLPFSDNSFDRVFSIMCFHEIDESIREKSFYEMIRVLKDSGRIILADPAFPSSDFQKVFDLAHSILFNFDHPTAVKEARAFLLQKNGEFNVFQKCYDVKYQFDNLNDLCKCVFDSFSDEISINEIQKEGIRKALCDSLDSKRIDTSTSFVLVDTVSVFCIEPYQTCNC